MPAHRARESHDLPLPDVGGAPAAVADRLHSAAIHLLRRLRRQDDASGMSAPRLSALSVLVFGGPVTLGQLAAAEQVRPPTMTRLVAALEARGLVVREGDPADARLTLVRATAKGKAVMARGRARRVETLTRALAELPAEELASLRRAADAIADIARRLPG